MIGACVLHVFLSTISCMHISVDLQTVKQVLVAVKQVLVTVKQVLLLFSDFSLLCLCQVCQKCACGFLNDHKFILETL